jgi:DNA helicase TIP49 (TBP-interacting protein)
MPFSKTFPKTTDKSVYPKWIEVFLTEEEERLEEKKCKEENIKLMKECIDDAREIIKNKNLKEYQTDLINMAISLFEKRASHAIYWKESKAKEKFDKQYSD